MNSNSPLCAESYFCAQTSVSVIQRCKARISRETCDSRIYSSRKWVNRCAQLQWLSILIVCTGNRQLQQLIYLKILAACTNAESIFISSIRTFPECISSLWRHPELSSLFSWFMLWPIWIITKKAGWFIRTTDTFHHNQLSPQYHPI